MLDSAYSDFRLDEWLVQPAQCRVSNGGRALQIRPKVMDLLTYFVAHQGEVVSKDRLLNDVWGSEAVSESALTRTVAELRQALRDDAGNPRLLETIPKRGYRLIGTVSVSAGDTDAVPPRLSADVNSKGWLVLGGIAIALAGAIGAWTWLRDLSRRSTSRAA